VAVVAAVEEGDVDAGVDMAEEEGEVEVNWRINSGMEIP
jgi:hypothetical protein